MSSNADRLERYVRRITKPELRELSRGGNVFSNGDTIYSYGYHFPMAEILRNANGKPTCVLVNGDTYSVSTSGHQSALRKALAKWAPDIPAPIIPYEALAAAGIDRRSVQALDVKSDGWEYNLRTSDTLPEAAEIVGEAGTYTPYYRAGKYLSATDATHALRNERGHLEIVERDASGAYIWHAATHWLGECLISARATGRKRRVKFLSGFDRNESARLYFLCELPPTTAQDIAGALEALKPDTARMAEAMGRECERQGDIFGVPMPGLSWADLKQQGGTLARRADARKGELARAKYARKFELLTQAEDVRFRLPDYLQHRENMRKSVFGNVPWSAPRAEPIDGPWRRGEATARAEAVGSHRAEKWREILRKRVLDAEAQTIDAADISLLGTAHTATHVVTMPDGTQYARGSMYHDPALMGENRERDHARCKLGDCRTWFLVQKNTVPIAKRSRVRS